MPNAFNYRCPNCGSTHNVVIDACISAWLMGDRPVVNPAHIGAESWNSTNPATCGDYSYSGTVADFEPQSGNVIALRTNRR